MAELINFTHSPELESVRIKRRKLDSESTSEVCTHPGSFGDMCIRCGQKLDGESGITLLNSTHLAHLNSQELHLISQPDSLGGSLFKLDKIHMMTKLRPFVRTFLREASQMFDMYIYTMGDRPYALEMAKLLDPQGKYFNAKVISRDDGTLKHQKGLDIVLGQESAVVILDDTEQAWAKHKDNLILMERYHFFVQVAGNLVSNCKSLAELKTDEDEAEGALTKILKVLKQSSTTTTTIDFGLVYYRSSFRLHDKGFKCTSWVMEVFPKFFDELKEDIAERDVRQILKSVPREVLGGSLPSLRKMAEQLGATCLMELDSSVTHVVATDAGTEKARWAVKEKRFLVHSQWIVAANYFWEKQPEESFVLKKKQ
ncbi:hypothetical protein AAHE18_07G065800 [Arachis hypogaea]